MISTLFISNAVITMHQPAQTSLDDICNSAVKVAARKLVEKKVLPENIAISVITLNDGERMEGGYRARTPMYPASVVKLFYSIYLQHLLSQKLVKSTPELVRGEADMIKESSNDATGYILDVITGTTGGPELSPRELKAWMDKRSVVNRWFASHGITGINVNQKTWNEGPYGRERQGYGPNFERRNSLTPSACTRTLALLSEGKLLPKSGTDRVLSLLNRALISEDPKADIQSRAFIGKALKPGYKLFSKAGYVTNERHDVAIIESPTGKRIVLAIFTKHSQVPDLIPTIASEILRGLGWDAVEEISGTELANVEP
jgi:hypothetical protein